MRVDGILVVIFAKPVRRQLFAAGAGPARIRTSSRRLPWLPVRGHRLPWSLSALSSPSGQRSGLELRVLGSAPRGFVSACPVSAPIPPQLLAAFDWPEPPPTRLEVVRQPPSTWVQPRRVGTRQVVLRERSAWPALGTRSERRHVLRSTPAAEPRAGGKIFPAFGVNNRSPVGESFLGPVITVVRLVAGVVEPGFPPSWTKRACPSRRAVAWSLESRTRSPRWPVAERVQVSF